MCWNYVMWKYPGFVPFGTNLTHFGAKPSIPVVESKHHLPFTQPQQPTSNNPKWKHEYKQHGTRANSHQRFEHEFCIKVNSVQGANTPGGGVCEELAVEQHHSADEVETQKHGHWQRHVHRNVLLGFLLAVVNRPREIEVSRDGVYRADEELDK